LLWLTDDADDWARQIRDERGNFKMVPIDETERVWSLDDWTSALREKFPVWKIPVLKKENTIQDLCSLNPRLPLTIGSLNKFNRDFQVYVNGIPAEEKTVMQILKAYKNTIAHTSREVYLNVKRENEHLKGTMTLVECMSEYLKELALQLSIPDDVEKSANQEKGTANDLENMVKKTADSIASLTKQMGDLTLLVYKERKPSSYKNVTCLNCGVRGHTSKQCDKMFNETEFKRRQKEYSSEKKDSSEDSKPNIDSETKPITAIQKFEDTPVLSNTLKTTTGKRVRIEDMLNDPPSPMEVDLKGIDPKKGKPLKSVLKKKKPIKGGNIDNLGSSLANKILNSQSSLTWKQTLGLVSQNQKDDCLKALKQSLNSVKPRKLVLFTNDDNSGTIKPVNKDVNEYYSYTLLSINSQICPVFLDKGSHLSVITKGMCDLLNIKFEPSNGKFLSPYGGEKLPILGHAVVTMEIAPETEIIVEFAVVQNAIVPLLLGLDALQPLAVYEDYDNNVLYWGAFEEEIRSQLYSKQELRQLEDVFDSEEDSFDDLYNIMHISKYEVMDVAIPDIYKCQIYQKPKKLMLLMKLTRFLFFRVKRKFLKRRWKIISNKQC
jgi:hypothetical protein